MVSRLIKILNLEKLIAENEKDYINKNSVNLEKNVKNLMNLEMLFLIML